MEWIFLILLGDLLGSTPTGFLISKAHGVDIFQIGSGSMGGTNVKRALGWRWALFVVIVDIAKGWLAVTLARALMPQQEALASGIAAVFAVIGHSWPIWTYLATGKLRGGKGAATMLGTYIAIAPLALVAAMIGIFVTIVLITKYVSFSTLTSVSAAFIGLLIMINNGRIDPAYVLYVLPIWFTIFFRHRSNIERLRNGTENRLTI